MERRWSARTPTRLCEVLRVSASHPGVEVTARGCCIIQLGIIFFLVKERPCFFFFLHVTSSSKCVMSFGEQMFGAHTHTHTFFFLSWMTLKWTWLKEKGESAGKTCRHGIRRPRRPLFMSRLQHSGETLEQWKYIESGRLLFSLGRTIIFGWLRTRVHI